MKKTLSTTILLFAVLIQLTPAHAGDVDGLWILKDPMRGPDWLNFVMLRENQGTLLMTVLYWPGLDGWGAFFGPFDGTTARISLLVSLDFQALEGSITFTSPGTASITATKCIDHRGSPCLTGTIATLEKIF